jgi:hypothetical protein
VIENEPSIALIGLLFAYFAGANLSRVSDPQFVAELREQTLEPMNRAGRFDTYAYRFRRTLQAPVERLRLAAFVVQSALHQQFCGFFSGHGNLLIACVKITSYNQHRSAPFFRALVVSATKPTRRKEPTPSSKSAFSWKALVRASKSGVRSQQDYRNSCQFQSAYGFRYTKDQGITCKRNAGFPRLSAFQRKCISCPTVSGIRPAIGNGG